MTIRRRRNSLRLNGFDYSQPAAYFVTLCIHGRIRVLGRVVDGRMTLSETGRIVEDAWKEIPDHFPTVRVDILQIMPDHVHGVVEIRALTNQNNNPVGVEYIQPRRGGQTSEFQHVAPNACSTFSPLGFD